MSTECETIFPYAGTESSLVTHLPEPLMGQVSWQDNSQKARTYQDRTPEADSRDNPVLSAAMTHLKVSESRLRAIIDTAGDAIFTMSPDGTIESFNKAAEILFGYNATDVIGANTERLISLPEQEHGQCLRKVLQTNATRINGACREVIGLKADGTEIPLELAVSEVTCDDGLLFTGVVRDISALKQALRQLKESNDELASHALAIAKFNQRLQRSNDEMSQFAYVASHDLQEPLRKVVGFCQALQDDYSEALDETARGYINYAVEGARRMRTLVTDLLSYSRVQTQGQPMEPTDAGGACCEAIQNLNVAIDNAGAEVTRGELPIINADHTQLVRLFQNLIGNAIKYRSEEIPHIQVDAEELQDEWLFRVCDNGLGIDPQYHIRIFIIFQRLHARDEYSGTGIGLAICKRIVERMGGRIWVESSLGQGSTFCFTAPKPGYHVETSSERCL